MHRRWRRGDVYAPHDLSSVEMSKWKAKRGTPRRDVFDELGIDPRNEYKNFALLGEFMTETGRIKHSNATGLRPRNQRRLAKAIRRAIGIGIMPSVHKHPELLGRRR
ncbi:ribosomal protein S18 [Viridothelium virens]|uniref:Small ribosomal subunit protein bS18m n=1 Tax=Viridothelium virens TaxID=1048519 RepID=A0A6A6GXP4_VIRVR|nr:ribosomal protein S18 [Viridothelium virens]